MKKKLLYLLIIVVAVILLLMLGTTKVNAEGEAIGDWDVLFVDEEGNVYYDYEELDTSVHEYKWSLIDKYRGSATNLTIPDSFKSVPVSSIEWGAFQECNTLKSVIIPATIIDMDYYAFADCKNLEEVTIQSKIDICDYAFQNCTALKKITIPKEVEYISENAFDGSKNVVVNCYIDSKAHDFAYCHEIKYNLLDTKDIATACNCDIEWMYSENYAYTGKEVKPEVYVDTKNYCISLEKGRDFTVSYSNNLNMGVATVTVTGKGNYTGTITKSFKIVPPAIKIKSVKNVKKKSAQIKWKRNYDVDGYEVYMAEAKKESYVKVTKKLKIKKSASTKSKTLIKLPKKSYVRVIKRNAKKSGGYTWHKVTYYDYNKDKDITGYIQAKYTKDIYYEGKYKKIKTIKGNKTTTYKKKKLTKNKKYIFKVKGYKYVDGTKFYSDDEFYEYGDIDGYLWYLENIKWVTINK